MSFLSDYQTEWGYHQIGACDGLSGGCLQCRTDGFNELLKRGFTVKQIQDAIIAHNDDCGEAIEELLDEKSKN